MSSEKPVCDESNQEYLELTVTYDQANGQATMEPTQKHGAYVCKKDGEHPSAIRWRLTGDGASTLEIKPLNEDRPDCRNKPDSLRVVPTADPLVVEAVADQKPKWNHRCWVYEATVNGTTTVDPEIIWKK